MMLETQALQNRPLQLVSNGYWFPFKESVFFNFHYKIDSYKFGGYLEKEDLNWTPTISPPNGNHSTHWCISSSLFFFFFKECEEYITFSPPAPFMCLLLSFLSSVINGITNVTGTPEWLITGMFVQVPPHFVIFVCFGRGFRASGCPWILGAGGLL